MRARCRFSPSFQCFSVQGAKYRIAYEHGAIMAASGFFFTLIGPRATKTVISFFQEMPETIWSFYNVRTPTFTHFASLSPLTVELPSSFFIA
jgi:hypothetical protein